MTDTEKEKELPLCFVIQPFDDGGTYDLRYKETIKPALEKAGLRPRRADEILGLNPEGIGRTATQKPLSNELF